MRCKYKYYTLKGVSGEVRPVDGRKYGHLGIDHGFVHLIRKGGKFDPHLFCGTSYFDRHAKLVRE